MNEKTTHAKKKPIYVLFILLQSLVYGIGNPITKIAYDSISPLWLLATRFCLAFAVIMLLFGKTVVSDLKKTSWKLWLPSSLCCAGAYISCNIALNMTTATNVGFIDTLPVLFAPILTVLFMRRKYNLRKIPIQLLAIAGLFLLCCNGGAFSFNAGDWIALFGAVCLAGVLVFGEKAMEQMEVISITALQVGVTAVLGLGGALMFDQISALASVQPVAWAVMAYHALFCTVLAYFLQNSAVNVLSANTVSMLQCTQPIFTAAVSFAVLGESLGFVGMIGGAVIIAALLLESKVG